MISASDCGGGNEGGGRSEAWREDDDYSDEDDDEMRMMSGMKCVPGGPGLSLTLCTVPPRTQKSPFIIQQICIFCQNYNLM